MKWLLAVFFVLLVVDSSAQTIRYTRRTTRLNGDEGAIVVPEIGGMNHLITISPGQRAKLQVYNDQLEWQREITLPFKIVESNDITILPFKDKYYLYNQSQAGTRSFLWQIDKVGNATDESSSLKALIRSNFKDSTIMCQLFSKGDNLFLFGNLYYPDIKKVVSTLIKTNSSLQQQEVKRFAYSFNHSFENLQKVVIVPEKNMVVLKKHSSEEGEYYLDVLKINLTNNKISGTNFRSQTPFNYPEALYNSGDSSVTVFAQMSRSYFSDRIIRNVFFATLNDTLEEKYPAATIKFLIDDEMYGAFTCLKFGNGYSKWLPVHGIWNSLYDMQISRRLLIGLSSMVTLEGGNTTIVGASSFQPKLQPIDPHVQFIAPPGDVRFTVINNRFRNVQDTVIKYKKRNFIEVAQYSSFTKNNTNYLVVKEQFPSKGKGLLLLRLNNKGSVASLPLHLYERYHYSLPQLQAPDKGKIYMPYVYKGEVGIVDVTLEGDE